MERANVWLVMFIQSALGYAYYLLPASRYLLSIAKFCVLAYYLLMEMAVFLAVFVIAAAHYPLRLLPGLVRSENEKSHPVLQPGDRRNS